MAHTKRDRRITKKFERCGKADTCGRCAWFSELLHTADKGDCDVAFNRREVHKHRKACERFLPYTRGDR